MMKESFLGFLGNLSEDQSLQARLMLCGCLYFICSGANDTIAKASVPCVQREGQSPKIVVLTKYHTIGMLEDVEISLGISKGISREVPHEISLEIQDRSLKILWRSLFRSQQYLSRCLS